MILFHDHDPAHPFPIEAERHTIAEGKIILDYTPLKGSVTIAGFSEIAEGEILPNTFFINYGDEDDYRSANQAVYFNAAHNGEVVSVSYQGVSTLLRAKHLNEIKDFMERGASEMAAGLLVVHEAAVIDALAAHCEHICSCLKELKGAVNGLTIAYGISQGTAIATDKEVDEALDEYFYTPDDGESSEENIAYDIAADDEVADMLDDVFGKG